MKWPPLIYTLVYFLLLAFLISCLLALWLGRRRVKKAVRQRRGPADTQAFVKASGRRLVVAIISALVAFAGVAAFSWKFFEAWIYNMVGGMKQKLAEYLVSGRWLMRLDPAEGENYGHVITFGVAAAASIGLLIGALIGGRLGVKFAAKGFLYTKKML